MLTDPTALIRGVGAGRRRGAMPAWRRVELRPVDIGAGRRLQITTYDDRQAFTANHEFGEPAARQVATLLAEPFANWHVEAVGRTVQLRVTKRGEAQVHRAATPHAAADKAEHDRVKPRLVDPHEPYCSNSVSRPQTAGSSQAGRTSTARSRSSSGRWTALAQLPAGPRPTRSASSTWDAATHT